MLATDLSYPTFMISKAMYLLNIDISLASLGANVIMCLKHLCSLSSDSDDSDAGHYVVIRKLVDSIFNGNRIIVSEMSNPQDLSPVR
jgi:hypothetical protein